MEFKVVIGTKDGKCLQKEFKGAEAEALHKKTIGDKISGDELGMSGYEFQVTGGSDKCGFPMRKGINSPRKSVMVEKSVGCSGKNRNKKKQKGLLRRRTVCGERVTKIIRQVNLKVLKEGAQPLGAPIEESAPEAAPEEKKETAPEEVKESSEPSPSHPPSEEVKEEPKEEKVEEETPGEKPKEKVPEEEPKEKVKPEPEEEKKKEE